MTVPTALTIAGSDSGGGAGIQADLKTFSALGVYGASVITALTAQNTRSVTAILDIDRGFIRAQLQAVFDDIRIDAVKIGMLSQPGVIETVSSQLARHPDVPVVLDPVMVAKSGDRLLQPDAVVSLRSALVPLATVITPNLPEAGDLLDREAPVDRDAMVSCARDLLSLGPGAVLLKGGHLESGDSADYLLKRSDDGSPESRWYTAPRINTPNTHGTGCSLSSAIAAGLARGLSLEESVQQAKSWLGGAIDAAGSLDIGSGHGPVHHFHRWWGA